MAPWRACGALPAPRGGPGLHAAALPGAASASSHEDFLFGSAPSACAHGVASAAASSFLGGDHSGRHAPSADDMHVSMAGVHVADGLRSARTALMVTGGMCNKLFGLGMMGFLVYQAVKSEAAQQAQLRTQRKNERQPELVRGVAKTGCCGNMKLASGSTCCGSVQSTCCGSVEAAA
ncbi:unnamed protein product [Prorocentrum cordatum]|uniref:Uncharacterized protein n=1 Tax=Prorocentrum cordatum TaxID=2364126 RepID=A0ABN9VK37_9DINO|nr:unnamed protein product [Polarella glacialis]